LTPDVRSVLFIQPGKLRLLPAEEKPQQGSTLAAAFLLPC